jgi:Zn-dependent membrane protease YugP
MEAANIVDNFAEVQEAYDQKSLLLRPSMTPEEILQSEKDPLRFCKGVILALHVSLLMLGIIIWVSL